MRIIYYPRVIFFLKLAGEFVMKKRYAIYILAAVLISGCSFFGKKSTQSYLNGIALKSLVQKAMNGNSSADSVLQNIVDLSLPVNNNYNSFDVDSVYSFRGHKFYYVLLTFPNPFYNRLAFYDSTFSMYLLDKSLTGFVNTSIIKNNNKIYLAAIEDFKSKDILELNRLSLFQITDSSVSLVFRDFTKLVSPADEFSQSIYKISEDRIITNCTSSKASPIAGKGDVFEFNYSLNKYVSPNEIFSKYIAEQINSFKHEPEKPEITNYNSALESVGIDPALDTLKSASNTMNNEGYSLTLTENWKSIKDISITDFLKTKMRGTRYINDSLGTTISVIMIPAVDSAEMFINYPLNNITLGKYKVRYSDKIELKTDFVQFFEYFCGNKKYILILKASKYTYKDYKDIYQYIINSFTIDC